jgi:membrane protease YdiL (CAAX protease family)
LGAGLYEELLFRLMLFPIIRAVLRMAGASERAGVITAIIVTSLIFSGAHYELFTGAGDVFRWYTFIARFLAGVFFNLLFVYRGFGICAGSHAAYDIYIALLATFVR